MIKLFSPDQSTGQNTKQVNNRNTRAKGCNISNLQNKLMNKQVILFINIYKFISKCYKQKILIVPIKSNSKWVIYGKAYTKDNMNLWPHIHNIVSGVICALYFIKI